MTTIREEIVSMEEEELMRKAAPLNKGSPDINITPPFSEETLALYKSSPLMINLGNLLVKTLKHETPRP